MEMSIGTSPLLADTDGGGVDDHQEFWVGGAMGRMDPTDDWTWCIAC